MGAPPVPGGQGQTPKPIKRTFSSLTITLCHQVYINLPKKENTTFSHDYSIYQGHNTIIMEKISPGDHRDFIIEGTTLQLSHVDAKSYWNRIKCFYVSREEPEANTFDTGFQYELLG